MTAEQAKKLGYEIVAASVSEVGLLKNGKGVRTWWADYFDGKLPDLEDPKVLECIELNEKLSPETQSFPPQ